MKMEASFVGHFLAIWLYSTTSSWSAVYGAICVDIGVVWLLFVDVEKFLLIC